ncbi:MAG: PD-(D/E)XK nuclease family protein [Candidatus Methylomirabilales bacterium]
MSLLRQKHTIGLSQDRCIYCSGKQIVKKGKRQKKLQTVQLWYCKNCDKVFTPHALKGKTYPIPVILDGLNYYHTGYSLEDSSALLQGQYGISATPTTLSHWLREYKGVCTYGRLRNMGKTLFPPQRVIQSTRLHHQQVYHYRIHRAKLKFLLGNAHHRSLAPLSDFLLSMATACPHRLFRQEGRGSDLKVRFDSDGVSIREKQNLAPRTTQLVLQGVSQNRHRHDAVQKFMLANDSVTVATEVPVYLLPQDIAHFKSRLGFAIPFENSATLTGHIDLVQVRNGSIHILDYKPKARHEKPIEQLTFYALALSRRTGLRLYDFTCAWFDENHYFEFFPLHVVLKKPRKDLWR